MGTDIHMIVQTRANATAPWVTTDAARWQCDSCNGVGTRTYTHYTTKADVTDPCYWCDGTGQCKHFRNRNYDLFAQLADVRNGRGFAGCDTGDGFIPVTPRRGLPDDVKAAEDFDDDGAPISGYNLGEHSFSWLTLAELMAYDLDRQTVCRGVVDAATWHAWDRKGAPRSWCDGISGPGVRIISDKDARDNPPTDRAYVRVSWAKTYREAGGVFWSRVVPALQALGAPDCVRIVFGFDS